MGRDSPLIERILRRGSPLLARVADRAAEHRLQVLLSIEKPGDGPEQGRVDLETHGFRVDAEYFYPASTVKLIAALAALRTLELLAAEHGVALGPETPMVIHPAFADLSIEDRDPSNVRGAAITVGHEVRKLALVSDNPAHNRLLALVGHRAMHEMAWAEPPTGMGLKSARLIHRLSEPRTVEENRRTPRVELGVGAGMISVPARESGLVLDNAGLAGLDIGRAHMVGDERVARPMSFLFKNRVSLADLHRLIVLTARRGRVNGGPAFELSAAAWDLLHDAMTIYPAASRNPVYSAREHPDHYVKFLLPGLRRLGLTVDPLILNKIGQAYGFTTENAYVVGPAGKPSFFLTATLYANESGVLNADSYDDKTVAEPFMADLGEAIGRTLWED